MANQSNITASLNIFLQEVWPNSLSKNSFNQYWADIIKTDPKLENVFLTMDVIWGGQTRNLIATNAISTASSSTSKVYNYLPLLQSETPISAEYEIGEATPSQRTLNINFDGQTINPMSVILSGEALAGFAEISLQVDGGDYDNRYIIMRGDMSGGIEFGVKESTVTTSIIDPSYTSDAITPAVFASKETISTIEESSIGQRYPLVFDSYPFVPCIRMSKYEYGPSFIAAYGHDHEVVNVYVNGNMKESTDPYRGWKVWYKHDDLNNPITVIEFNYVAATPIEWESGDTVYADLRRIDQQDRTLLDIIKEILIKASLLNEVSFDEKLFFRAQSKLIKLYPKCLINGSGSNDTTTALEYIQSTLLSEFPMVSMTFTGRGYGPIVTDRRSDVVVMNLVARQQYLFDRTTQIQESPKDAIKNSFVLRYNYNSVENKYHSVIYRNKNNTPLCKISEDKFGRHDGPVMESVTIFDHGTANAVLDWFVYPSMHIYNVG